MDRFPGPQAVRTSSERSLLIVEDEESVRFSVKRYFGSRSFTVREAATAAGGVEAFRAHRPDVAFIDYRLPDGDGLTLLRTLRGVDPAVPLVILTGHATIDVAVRAMKEGAENFVTKPFDLATLELVAQRAIENRRNRQLSLAGRSHEARVMADPFVGESPSIRRLEEQTRRVVETASTVLLLGETGTGKGLLASWMHRNGPRAQEAFVDINCAGLSREFLETELFGHEKGAFTGAVAAKPGLFEIGHHGTLFLDEVGDMDAEVQPKLLKVLEERRIRRLGAVVDQRVDVRLITATHRDLEAAVQSGRLRADLYYRIGGLALRVPPLRERGDDVVLIARRLLDRIGGEIGRAGLRLTREAEHALLKRDWPGNIRELRNVLERAVLLGNEGEVRADDILGSSRLAGGHASGNGNGNADADLLSLREVERRHIERVLQATERDTIRAAAVLGLSRSALYAKIRKHHLPLGHA